MHLHFKILDDKALTKPLGPCDGRSFNKRSKSRMEREARLLSKSLNKSKRAKNTTPSSSSKRKYMGIFSEEDIQFEAEERAKQSTSR